jgi:hypothetical protein
MTTRLLFHADRATIPADPNDGEIPVWMFGPSPPYAHAASVGSSVLDLASRLTVQPSLPAMDFAAIAMAVTAADTFVSRLEAANGWARSFELVVPLNQPDLWTPLKPILERGLAFLSGDEWNFEFTGGGVPPPPTAVIKRRLRRFDLSALDCVALFSGGLDSALGALDLLDQKLRPLLVSHAPRGDSEHQDLVAARLPAVCQRFSFNSYPTWSGVDDDSMRTRSFQFIAVAALAADAISQFRNGKIVDLYLCENGFIALNPPLTVRRIGSLSTRTAHPHFLGAITALFEGAGLPVRIDNPYHHQTKGEMLAAHAGRADIDDLVAESVSCGKWKRKNQQCGRCLPCLIRRASIHAAGLSDATAYQTQNLSNVMLHSENRDDLIAVQAALRRRSKRDDAIWVLQSGPLPRDASERGPLFEVVRRGCDELEAYLRSQGLYV